MVAIALKHSFRPGREDFRQHLVSARPRQLAQASVSTPSAPQIREIVEGMTAQTWRADGTRLLALLAS